MVQAEEEFRQQLEKVRQEGAAALMHASLTQRKHSKAEEAWEAERSALGMQLAEAAQIASQQAIDQSAESRCAALVACLLLLRCILCIHDCA